MFVWSKARRRHAAFTLIELLVVVAIIALLLSILLPSLTAAREQGKRAKCLASLKGLAIGTQTYSTEDKSEVILPQHPIIGALGRSATGLGGGDMYWQMRMFNWYLWGGRSSQVPLDGRLAAPGQQTLSSGQAWFSREIPPGDVPVVQAFVDQSAETRPMNRYILSGGVGQADARKLDWFKCPSDNGFPNSVEVDDVPRSSFNRPLYDMMGNSYRMSLIGYIDATAGTWHYTSGAGGKKITTIRDTAKVVAFGEPRFFNMIGRDQNPAPNEPSFDIVGWHKRRLYDNLVFCDGSARYTKAEKRDNLNDQQVLDYRIEGNRRGLFARAATYQLGTYPTPGSAFVGTVDLAASSLGVSGSAIARWPWAAGRAQ